MSSHPNKNPHENHRQRVYRRYLTEGLDAFAPHEVLELMLFFAIPRRDVNPLAHRLIDHFGSLSGVLDAHPLELAKVKGMSERSAILLSIMPQLMRRYETEQKDDTKLLDTSKKVGRYAQSLFISARYEKLYVLCLDQKSRLIRALCLAEGTAAEINVPARKVVETALLYNAAQMVIAHNHPGGEATPSAEDTAYTRQIGAALSAIGIPLLDHMIVGSDGVYSFELGMRLDKG